MAKPKKSSDGIPQVIAIVSPRPDGSLSLKKAVRQHLELSGNRILYLRTRDEIILSTQAGRGKKMTVDSKNRIRLTEKVLKTLGIVKQIGLVERGNAIAIKAFKIVEEKGDRARFVDIETSHMIIRKVETNPALGEFLPKLVKRYKGMKLRYNIHAFLEDRNTLEAWLARRILGCSEASDKRLRRFLIEERLENQQGNGSWENHVPVTARNLRELADLGRTRKDKRIQKALDWLMDRPQSAYNPGIWFATDELIQEQAEVIKRRQRHKGKGSRERFNQRKALEVNLVRAAEPLASEPCGPRIMWTTATVMEALLKLGCENAERVKTALGTLTLVPMWCDNTYQHGSSEWKRTTPPSIENIEQFKKYFIESFKYGGICNPQVLLKADASHQPFYLRRVAHCSTKNGEEYLLNMPDAGEGCNIVMVRALSKVRNNKLKKILELHLWRYAGLQNFRDGSFSLNPYRIFSDLQTAMLQLFSSYDHPVAKLAILRALPWIINNQNKDGSWGTEPVKDATTYAVLSALLSVRDELPSGFIP
ncbi:MAG: hypothetical protein ACYSYV_05100 [Planctomycetota bacterium]|jgi:hypothetical protein